MRTAPALSRSTISVKVPPTSTPMRQGATRGGGFSVTVATLSCTYSFGSLCFAIATTARRFDDDTVAYGEHQVLLAREFPARAVSKQRHAERKARRTTLQPVRRNDATLEHGGERQALAQHRVAPDHSIAAAMAARAARLRPK